MLYFNVFVLVVQSFERAQQLRAIAPRDDGREEHGVREQTLWPTSLSVQECAHLVNPGMLKFNAFSLILGTKIA